MASSGSSASTKHTFLKRVAGDVALIVQACENAQFALRLEWGRFPVEIARRLLGDFDQCLALIEGLNRPIAKNLGLTKQEMEQVTRTADFGRTLMDKIRSPLIAASFANDHTAPPHHIAVLKLAEMVRDLPGVQGTGQDLVTTWNKIVDQPDYKGGAKRFVGRMTERAVFKVLGLLAALLLMPFLSRCTESPNKTAPEEKPVNLVK